MQYKCIHPPYMHENRFASCMIQMHASTLLAWNRFASCMKQLHASHAWKQISIRHDTNACIHFACMKTDLHHAWYKCIHPPCMHETDLHHARYKCMHPPFMHGTDLHHARYKCMHLPCMHETDLHHAWYKCMHPTCMHENKLASCMIQMHASTLHAWTILHHTR